MSNKSCALLLPERTSANGDQLDVTGTPDASVMLGDVAFFRLKIVPE